MTRVETFFLVLFVEDIVTFEKMLEAAHMLDEGDDVELLLDEFGATVDEYFLSVFFEAHNPTGK